MALLNSQLSKTALTVASFALVSFRSPTAGARQVPPPTALTAGGKATAPTPSKVAWQARWRPVATWEYFATAGVMGGAFALRFAGPKPPDNWRGGTPLDDVLGDGVRLDSPALADEAATTSDVLYFGSMAYRLVDAVMVPGIGYDDWYLARQMAMIDLESFAVVAAVEFGSQIFVGRQRPEYNHRCDDPAHPANCGGGSSRFRSFIAGHPATVLTAAGLTCTHHTHVPLYGGGWGDTLACGLMVGAAGFTGATRVLAGKHYPSDLVLGLGVGAFAGWVLPRALHYGFSKDGYYERPEQQARTDAAPAPAPASPLLVSVVPWSGPSLVGLRARGLW